MIIATTTPKTLLQRWERTLLALPALAGLVLGPVLVFTPGLFATLTQFPDDDSYIYRLAGAAILGYGIALLMSVFQDSWLTVRLVVIGVLVNNLGSLYACAITIFTTRAPTAVFIFLVTSLVFVVICSLLLVRHRSIPLPPSTITGRLIRLFLVVGAAAAGAFGIFPLFVPALFTVFHLHINAPFVIRQAGAASLGYAAVALLAQRAKTAQQLWLSTVMAGVFNGVGGLISLFFLFTGGIFLLPWVIAPVGLAVMVVCMIVLRQIMGKAV